MNGGDAAVAAGTQLVLHLHRFDDHERLARSNDFSWADQDADHLAGHGRQNPLRSPVTAGVSPGIFPGVSPSGATGVPVTVAPPAIHADGKRYRTDVDDELRR